MITKIVDFTFDSDGLGKGFDVHAAVKMDREMYGQDADGNRGEMRWSIEEIEKLEIKDGVEDVTDLIEEKHPDLFKDILGQAENEAFESIAGRL